MVEEGEEEEEGGEEEEEEEEEVREDKVMTQGLIIFLPEGMRNSVDQQYLFERSANKSH